MVHIDKGCLSGIPPGCGTNRNERLHKDLNAHMTNSIYGVELAYALLTSLFFRHNEHISSSREHRSEAKISAHSTEGELESFGLSSVCRNESPEPEVHAPISKVKMVKLEYQKVQQLLNSLEIDSSIEEVTQDNTNLEFTSEEVLSILKQAVSAFYVSLAIQ